MKQTKTRNDETFGIQLVNYQSEETERVKVHLATTNVTHALNPRLHAQHSVATTCRSSPNVIICQFESSCNEKRVYTILY